MRPTIVLFDIDGTLLNAHGAGKQAFVRGFTTATNLAPEAAAEALRFSFAGMTDFAIAREGVRRAQRAADPALFTAIVDSYLVELEAALCGPARGAAAEAWTLIAGARECMHAACALPNVAVGVGTGNVKAGARLKLEVAGLWANVAFGGYGCDAEARPELLRIGAARGHDLLRARGYSAESARVVVVGDTLKDVSAALAIGAECIGVATGRDSIEDLVAAGATHAFADLASPMAMAAIIG
jgi:phosphoglycolate phosphatase